MVSLCYQAIINYITDDNLPGLQNFLENKRVLIDDRDENGGTALHFAAAKGKLAFVRELINHGADVNAEDNDNWSALLCAAKENAVDVCNELLDHGADIEHHDMGGWTALMWGSYRGHFDVVSLLLERRADVNAHGNFNISSLLWAAGRGHADIAKMLIGHGAKVNAGDKYGTTALVWASRKGHVEIVDALLKAGANADTAGMNSWTPLLVAAQGNHVDVSTMLLECRPNVNALDKDGCTALTIACKEGFHDIVIALLNANAYINIQDRSGDTNLIYAVKGGHRSIVEALLKKYADVDIPGKDRKTATYTCAEKGNVPILRLLMTANPDLEVTTKDGDTALLRAVRSRHTEVVQLLLERKAKVNATDRRGDSALHIAMRARSRAIVEVLLRNPKNSQLLYKPNRAGETPYNIDMNHQKTLLGQIFGARPTNTNEDHENRLGYDLYSSALADILSEPSLAMPITVGLFAKWGSGKSFLLNKLREEMMNFADQWGEPVFRFSWLLFGLLLHTCVLVGFVLGLATSSWFLGIIVAVLAFVLFYTVLLLISAFDKRYAWDWSYNFGVYMTHKMNAVKVVLKVMFWHPPGPQWGGDSISTYPLRYYFTDQARVSSTGAGENLVVQMIGSLYDAIENDYGAIATRLYRALRPRPVKPTSSWRWRRLCCLPNIVLFELYFVCVLVGLIALQIYLLQLISSSATSADQLTLELVTMTTCAILIGLFLTANIYTIGCVLTSLVSSQRRQMQRSIARLDSLKSEGFLQELRAQVFLMIEMVRCLDGFRKQQSRLVIIVDGLDSCEQDKVLLVLDAIHVLFSDVGAPFIIILAIDPHVISKAVEVNSRRLLSEVNIGGHEYLHNMVHLPFYLQNSGLRTVKAAQRSSSHHHRKSVHDPLTEPTLVTSVSTRRLSTESGGGGGLGLSSQEKLKLPSGGGAGVARAGSRKMLKLSDSIGSSLGSNLNRAGTSGGAHDLTKMLLTDDYFNDVNPRSMRRLMNVVYITGRLLKAFNIDFNWYHLTTWANITEQWPFRTSWIILYHDLNEDSIEDNAPLKALYDKVRPFIPVSKEIEPLLELDRDEHKFDVYLTKHRTNMLVSDLRMFLPFTINLDPYIKKVIKEEQQNFEEANMIGMSTATWGNPLSQSTEPSDAWANRNKAVIRRQRTLQRTDTTPAAAPSQVYHNMAPVMAAPWAHSRPGQWTQESAPPPPRKATYRPVAPITQLSADLLETPLSSLSVDGVQELFSKISDLQRSQVPHYLSLIHNNNINGRVLLHCDLDELKKVLQMSFGDWELFRMVIVSMREHEMSCMTYLDEAPTTNRSVVRFASSQDITEQSKVSTGKNPHVSSGGNGQPVDKERLVSKQSVIEKQVTLEEQMICGALQTLNEEACEDVLDEVEAQSDESNLADQVGSLLRAGCRTRSLSQGSFSAIDNGETNVIMLQNQSSSLRRPSWTAALPPPSVKITCEEFADEEDNSDAAETPEMIRRLQQSGYDRSARVSLPVLHPLSASDGESPIEHIPAMRSMSTDHRNQQARQEDGSVLGGRRSGAQNGLVAPLVTVTPATNCTGVGNDNPYDNHSSDDETTPLVSELASPVARKFSNEGFGTSNDSSPQDDPPLEEIRTVARFSVSYNLARQNAFDNDHERRNSSLDDPETTV